MGSLFGRIVAVYLVCDLGEKRPAFKDLLQKRELWRFNRRETGHERVGGPPPFLTLPAHAKVNSWPDPI
jgi:hypothetical protein